MSEPGADGATPLSTSHTVRSFAGPLPQAIWIGFETRQTSCIVHDSGLRGFDACLVHLPLIPDLAQVRLDRRDSRPCALSCPVGQESARLLAPRKRPKQVDCLSCGQRDVATNDLSSRRRALCSPLHAPWFWASGRKTSTRRARRAPAGSGI